MRTLEMRYPRSDLTPIWRHLQDPRKRSTALELLDNLLEPALKEPVLHFLEDAILEEKPLHAGRYPVERSEPLAFLRGRCSHHNPYKAYVALDAAAVHEERRVLYIAERFLDHPDPLAREGAILAMRALGGAQRLEKRLDSLVSDSDPVVAGLARRILSHPEVPMHSTGEKILFLMSVPIFSKLHGEDLAPLARVAGEETFPENHVILKEGEEGDCLYVIMRGEVSVLKGGACLATLGPGETFGEMSVLDATVRSSDVVARVETETLKIGSDEFYEILHEQAEIAEGVLKVLTQRLRDLQEKRLGTLDKGP
jgi:CRP/FNR family cyclic AMP-dependent transcriptional regulator